MQDLGRSKSPRRPHGGTQVGKRVSFHDYPFTRVLVLASLVLVGLTVMEQDGRSQSTNQDSTANNAVLLVTSKLQALQFYQLAIPSPQPTTGSFDAAAADRGDELFSGKAKCNNCHVEPLWSDSGWNLHTPTEVCIDSFQANRAPDHRYRTSPIGDLFTHTNGGFYHDGRFSTMADVVEHYNTRLRLGLRRATSFNTC